MSYRGTGRAGWPLRPSPGYGRTNILTKTPPRQRIRGPARPRLWPLRLRPLALAFLLPAIVGAQAPASDREAAWRQDIAFFAPEFAAGQKDFDKLYPRAEFDAAIDRVTRNLASTDDATVVLGLMRIVASAHVGHTYVRMPTTGPLAFHRLPIAVQWFSDGLLVVAATEAHRDLIGLVVTKLGTLAPEALEKAVAPFVAYETDSWLRLQGRTFMLAEDVLRALGQVDAVGRVTITVAATNGTDRSTIRLQPIPWADPAFITAADVFNMPMGPARRDLNRNYRYEILPDRKTLYIRYNRCADDPQQPFAAFASEIFAAFDANPNAIDRVIVDLRTNGGGKLNDHQTAD